MLKARHHPAPPAAVVLMLLTLVGGCASLSRPADGSNPTRALRTELYLGLTSKAGDVSESDFQRFLDEVVTPRFSDGYTVVAAEGRWQDPRTKRTYREPSRVLVLVRPDNLTGSNRVEEIRRLYKERFRQDSTLRVDQPVVADF